MIGRILLLVFLTASLFAKAQEESISLPNIITPNGDGRNDRFVVGEFNLANAPSLLITDRWGKTVYETTRYLNEWDANNHDGGTYFYSLITDEGRKYFGQITVAK